MNGTYLHNFLVNERIDKTEGSKMNGNNVFYLNI